MRKVVVVLLAVLCGCDRPARPAARPFPHFGVNPAPGRQPVGCTRQGKAFRTRSVRAIRQAMAPRLAISTLSNMAQFHTSTSTGVGS